MYLQRCTYTYLMASASHGNNCAVYADLWLEKSITPYVIIPCTQRPGVQRPFTMVYALLPPTSHQSTFYSFPVLFQEYE